MRLMRLRELSDENKSKSHGNVTRSASAYGDAKYVRCVKLVGPTMLGVVASVLAVV